VGLSRIQIEAIAACIATLRAVPRDERLDCLVVLCKSLLEERLSYVLFPEDARPGRRER
jgi:hypothetical protein